jgi:AAA ATPase domain
MDPRRNPFSPGAGTPPPELAGRDELRERVSTALDRIRNGRSAQSVILYGLRGVGKTVLLNELRLSAEAAGMAVVAIESPEDRSLPAALAPALRTTLLRMDRLRRAADGARRALQALAGFIKLKAHYGDIELALDIEPLPGVADSGDLEADLSDLVQTVGEVARENGTAVILFIDELQYIPEPQLAALIAALHRANQRQLPITMVGAGLPQLLGRMGRAKSYAERLFVFEPVDALQREAAYAALREPVRGEQESIDDAALAAIFTETRGYPYFLQEWGKQSWDVAEASPITDEHVQAASRLAVAQLDASFFRVRFDRLTPAEKRYMRAMAELGEGPHRSGEIALKLGVKVTSVGPTRNTLIQKGMIFSPDHGDTAFTVPMFDAFMRRVMPSFD